MSVVLGVDIGGTKTLVTVADGDGPLGEVARLDTRPQDGAAACVDRIAAAAEPLLGRGRPMAVGVACGGPLDPGTGVLHDPPHLRWGDFPLAAALGDALGAPVRVWNDCTLGALGEAREGAGRGCGSMVYAGVGTGVGGGLVVAGEAWNGATGNAAEIGHLIVHEGGAPCRCGRRGCMEAYCAGWALQRTAGELARSGASPALAAVRAAGREPAGADLQAAAAAGCPAARAAWDAGADALGLALGAAIGLLDPEVVVVGGGVAVRAGAAWLERAAAAARDVVFAPQARACPVRLASLGDRSALWGAVWLAREAGG